jgi:hypothetical protein
MMVCTGDPFCKAERIMPLTQTISASFVVRSSSVLAFSCATDGRIQTGGAGTNCQMNISGLPSVGSSPRSSQSVGLIILKRFRTLSGLRSSIAFRRCFSSSGFSRLATEKEPSNLTLLSGGTFFADVDLLKCTNLSCASLRTPILRICPLTELQYGQIFVLRHCSLILLQIAVRRKLSRPGRRSSLRKERRSGSSNRTRPQS